MIKVGIYGYGNLAKGVEQAIKVNKDLELVAVFTRRDPSKVSINTPNVKVVSSDNVLDYQNKIDVLIICGGSATDLPTMTPYLSKYFNVIDSFDTHANISTHFKNVNDASLSSNHTSLISCGWDPGMFSLNRIIMESILPDGKSYTFWGRGVSQGHSDAIRRIKGVIDARQYTCPVEKALTSVRICEQPSLSVREMHTRECYVVAEEGADLTRIEKEIKEMPNYFSDYDTTVNFISLEELKAKHYAIPHGGFVIRTGKTNDNVNHVIEYSLKLDSNPEFTGSVLVAYARAIYRLSLRKDYGCKTVFDIAPKDISPVDYDELLKHTL